MKTSKKAAAGIIALSMVFGTDGFISLPSFIPSTGAEEISENYMPSDTDEVTGFIIAEPNYINSVGTKSSPLLRSSDQQLVYERIIAMKTEYPEGMPWTNSNSYVWKNIMLVPGTTYAYGSYMGGGCVAFAMIMSDAAFGDAYAREIKPVKFEDVRVGDILRINNNTHSTL